MCDHKGKLHRQVLQGGTRKVQCLDCDEVTDMTDEQITACDKISERFPMEPPVVIP